MNHSSLRFLIPPRRTYRGSALICFSLCIAASSLSAAPCGRASAEQDRWVEQRVNALVRAAHAAYENEKAQPSYERVLDSIVSSIQQCRLTDDRDFVGRYREFVEYVKLLSLARRDDHELGFEISDEQYFAETSQYTNIPDFLLTPRFLRAVSRFETLPQAKALLRELNAGRGPDAQLLFFSYTSRHLGTPDNPDSYRRLLIVVPGNPTKQLPEKWVQFGIADPGKPRSVRNVSVVAVVPAPDQRSNVYFKDYFRTYRRGGSINIRGRWELGEGDDNCVSCHKSGVLPIFPVAGSVRREEKEMVKAVNQRFRGYEPARFGGFLDASKFGPGLGSIGERGDVFRRIRFETENPLNTRTCASCHRPGGLGSLNWPMDSTLISSFVKGGQMPLGAKLSSSERAQLYRQLVDDYFAIDDACPGILKAWLLGKMR